MKKFCPPIAGFLIAITLIWYVLFMPNPLPSCLLSNSYAAYVVLDTTRNQFYNWYYAWVNRNNPPNDYGGE